MGYKPRWKEPLLSNKYYKHTSAGGLNDCMLIDHSTGSVLQNCVGYAWGRAYELMGEAPKLSKRNAWEWWGHNDGYKRGQTPRLGAIAVWGPGPKPSESYGHVAVVEKLGSRGSFTVVESVYRRTKFAGDRFVSGNRAWGGMPFMGFIYIPIEGGGPVIPPGGGDVPGDGGGSIPTGPGFTMKDEDDDGFLLLHGNFY